MNPQTPNAMRRRVDDELRDIRAAWPTAVVTRGTDGLNATAVVHDPNSTYVIEVDPEGTRSLWVSHTTPIRESYVPSWEVGWVD